MPPVALSSRPSLPRPSAPRCLGFVPLVACLCVLFARHRAHLAFQHHDVGATTTYPDPGAASQGRQEHARTPLDSVIDLVKHTAFYMHQRSTEPDVVSSEQGQRR